MIPTQCVESYRNGLSVRDRIVIKPSRRMYLDRLVLFYFLNVFENMCRGHPERYTFVLQQEAGEDFRLTCA